MTAAGVPAAIVNISSINAFAASDGISHYAAAKAAVAQFTKVAAAEFAPFGIRVNAVAPGLTRTPMSEGGFLSGRMLEEFLVHTPMGRPGEPDDIAKVVTWTSTATCRISRLQPGSARIGPPKHSSCPAFQ